MQISPLSFSSNVSCKSNLKFEKANNVNNNNQTANATSSFNSLNANKAIMNNLSFTGKVVSAEFAKTAPEKYKKFSQMGKEILELCKRNQLDHSFSHAGDEMIRTKSTELIKNGFKP